jgi:uncharacterized membrane protein YgcG
MVPYLHRCDMAGALGAAMAKVDANATPEHAATLEGARQVNAVLGLVVAPLLMLILIGGSILRWWAVGKDPVYLDDPSILMPAPPPGLTPAAGSAVREGKVTRRALTASSLDLAVRGLVAFRAEPLVAGSVWLGIYTGTAVASDPGEQARLAKARGRPMDAATQYLEERLGHAAGAAGYLPPDRIHELAKFTGEFDRRLETHLVEQGWYRAGPSAVAGRWTLGAVLLFILGLIVAFLGLNMPASGAILVGAALIVSGVAVGMIGRAMPARTKSGAVIRAMLEAYRRTLEKTMVTARSMGDVATAAAIPLIESPDDAVAWGVALGLQDEVEGVLQRSAADRGAGAQNAYLPAWYLPAGMEPGSGPAPGGGGGFAPGLMSASPIPDFGGMMAALGTIGTPPAPSGDGGGFSGGGFGGGGSGGGGGGAGGGF